MKHSLLKFCGTLLLVLVLSADTQSGVNGCLPSLEQVTIPAIYQTPALMQYPVKKTAVSQEHAEEELTSPLSLLLFI
ncbi:hypothetical protein ACFSQD_06130 [Flavihumibacter stibioxidans]|uniref:Uncharacterized protein n=1 Tax=Flavihumibacter stibioxidans TaxID=1834163 RepID=A0ABR7M4T7_9BACT|nr:hypothetical protein [Flavihumibacter stibioxidans]MBC6489884.1 hypothetical protein [Flavihumibacter stibioxidans]